METRLQVQTGGTARNDHIKSFKRTTEIDSKKVISMSVQRQHLCKDDGLADDMLCLTRLGLHQLNKVEYGE